MASKRGEGWEMEGGKDYFLGNLCTAWGTSRSGRILHERRLTNKPNKFVSIYCNDWILIENGFNRMIALGYKALSPWDVLMGFAFLNRRNEIFGIFTSYHLHRTRLSCFCDNFAWEDKLAKIEYSTGIKIINWIRSPKLDKLF